MEAKQKILKEKKDINRIKTKALKTIETVHKIKDIAVIENEEDFHEPPDKDIPISEDHFLMLEYLCDNFKLDIKNMTEYLIKREYKHFICGTKLLRTDHDFLDERYEPIIYLTYEISMNGDVVHYLKFLKEVENVTKKCKIKRITCDEIIMEVKVKGIKNKRRIHNIVISYYPFEAIRREQIKGFKGTSIFNEIIKVGRVIQILRDQHEIRKTQLIRSKPILPKTDEELFEEILSWG